MRKVLSKDWFLISFLFLLAVVFRMWPELKGGAWPIGYDTLNTYVPDILKFDGNFWRWLLSSNLIYFVMWPIYKIFGDANLTSKITGCLIYGGLAGSFYIFLRKFLAWPKTVSFLGVLFLIPSVAALRISWDLYRNMLALIFLFPAIYFLYTNHKTKNLILTALFSLLVILSNQLVSAIWFIILAIWLIKNLSDKDYKGFFKILAVSTPVIVMFIVILKTPGANSFGGHVFYQNEGGRVLNYFDVYKNKIEYNQLAGTIWSLFWLCFKLILPFSVIGFWLLRKNLILTTVTVWLLLGTFSSLIFGGFGLFVWDRWLVMLVFPLTIYAVWGIFSAGIWIFNLKTLTKLKKTLRIAGVLWLAGYLVFIFMNSLPFITADWDHTKAPYLDEKINTYFPPTMVHNSVGFENIKSVNKAIDYLDQKAPAGSVILVDNRYRGIVLSRMNIAENFVYSYPWSKQINTDLINDLRRRGIGPIYTIWSSQKELSGFKMVHYYGLVGVFRDKQTYQNYLDSLENI